MNDYAGYVTLRDAATFFGTSPIAIYRYVTRHHIPTRRAGYTLLVRLVDLADMRVRAGKLSDLQTMSR